MGETTKGGSTSIPHGIDYDVFTHCEAIAYYDVGTCLPLPRVGFNVTVDAGYDTNYFIDDKNIIVQAGSKTSSAAPGFSKLSTHAWIVSDSIAFISQFPNVGSM